MHKEIELVVAKSNDGQLNEHEFYDAPDSFFTRIAVQDVLEMSEHGDVLDRVVAKVRKGGTLLVEGIDALDVCRRVHYGQMHLQDASSQFFKNTNNLNSVATLKHYFVQKQWNVKFAGLNNGRYLLEVVRK